MDYDYENVIESTLDDYQRQMIWEYTNLGISPMDKEVEEFVKNYLN
ncbi:immunity protein YezG family protein [Bacillus subtilis]